MRRVVAVISARPCIHVNHAARRDHKMARVTNAVGKNGRAKTGRQCHTAIVAWASLSFGGLSWAETVFSVRPRAACPQRGQRDDDERKRFVRGGESHEASRRLERRIPESRGVLISRLAQYFVVSEFGSRH